jgi:hypothetical protein
MATTTPNYGWDVPTSTDYVKDGATAIETLGDDIDATLYTALGGAYPGLRLIKKQTIGSGVSSVSVTSAFSATYEAYKIVITGGTGSGNGADLQFKLGSSTTGYYYVLVYSLYTGGSVLSALGNNAATMALVGEVYTDGLSMNMEVNNPFLAKNTTVSAGLQRDTIAGRFEGVHKVATSYTDFTITPNTGTLTGGTIYVYGYGAS